MTGLKSFIDRFCAILCEREEKPPYDPFWEDFHSLGSPESAPVNWREDVSEFMEGFVASFDSAVLSVVTSLRARWSRSILACERFFLRRMRHRERLPLKTLGPENGKPDNIRHAKIEITSVGPAAPEPLAGQQTDVRHTKKPHLAAYLPAIMARVKHHLTSTEFWLGVAFGAVTRIMTRVAILEAFPDSPGFAAAVGFLAFAIAGIAAGAVAFLVRAKYRNTKAAAAGLPQEKYWTGALLQSALIGLFGGLLGGYAVNAGTVLAQSGGHAVGVTAGLGAGAIHAGARIYAVKRRRTSDTGWGKLAFQSAVMGVFGGAVGVVLSEVMGTSASVAAPAPVGEAGSVVYVPPSATSAYVSDFCKTCGYPPAPPQTPTAAPVAPVTTVHVAPVEPQDAGHKLVEKPAPRPKQPPPRPRVSKQVTDHPPKPKAHQPDPARKVAKVRHIKKLKPAIKLDDKYIVLDKPKYLTPPPHAIKPQLQPPPQVITPPPVDPCAVPPCAPSCNNVQIDIKGPCADPSTPCVQNVHFDASGKPTKVVLESRNMHATEPYYEISTPKGVTAVNWRRAGDSIAEAIRDQGKGAKVSLLFPIANNATLALANGASPTPA